MKRWLCNLSILSSLACGSPPPLEPAAPFKHPLGVAADGAGNLFVADTGNAIIRKVVLSTGVVSTLAGSAGMRGSTDGIGSAARFVDPQTITVDGAGNLFVADSYFHVIRKVEISTGVVSTLAGSPAMAGSADGTGSAARFYDPQGIAADGAGNLYVVDSANHTIRKVVVSTGAVTTLAGAAGMAGSSDGIGPAARFLAALGMAADRAGHVYVADTGNETIRQLDLASGAVTTVAGSVGMIGSTDGTGPVARFYVPWGVAADGAGNLYVADSGNQTLRKVVVATGAVSTVAGAVGKVGSADGIGPAARFLEPRGITLDGAGNLYVADSANDLIRKVVLATGSVSTLVGLTGQ